VTQFSETIIWVKTMVF